MTGTVTGTGTEIDQRELAQQFASDNYAGICPEAWQAMEEANRGHATAYGDDPWTGRAADAFRNLFEAECEVYFVFNGTAANSLALASLCQSYHGVICCDQAHVETDECGAPEFFSNGSKLLVAPSAEGKLTPQSIHELAVKKLQPFEHLLRDGCDDTNTSIQSTYAIMVLIDNGNFPYIH